MVVSESERSNPVLEKNIRQDTYLEDLFWTIMITRELSWSLEDLGFTSGPVALAPTSCAAAPILTLFICAHTKDRLLQMSRRSQYVL